MLNHSVNFKQNLKGFFFVLIIAAGLFGTSCLGATKDKGEVSFSIPATALQAIAARAGEIAEGSGYTQPQQEQIALTLKLSLHLASNGKTIAAKTKEGNLKDWLEEQEPLYFSFTGITTNIEIYAEASVTAVINGQTKELGHNKSDSKTVYEGENDFSFTIKLDTKDLSGNNGQTPKPTPGPNTDTTIKFNITITNDDTAVNNLNPAVSLFYIDEQKASMLSGTGYADISNPQVFMELMQNNQNFLNTFDVRANNDNSITIQTQFTSGEKIAAGKKLYLLAVANYDDWDLFENETLASQQAKITSYRGWTNELTVGAENEVSIELERADIPCKVSYKKYTDETCTAFDNLENTSYVKIASYNENVTTNHLILDALQNELTAICPDNYELSDKMNTEFEDNFVTATIYFKPKAQSQDPNTGGGSSTDPNTGGASTDPNTGSGGSTDPNTGGGSTDPNTGGGGESTDPNTGGGSSTDPNTGGGSTDPNTGSGGGNTQTTYTGGGSIIINPSTNPNANLLEITATPSEKFYLNTGSINLGAVIKQNGTDLSDNTSVTWNAQLLYGGVDINDYGIEYYTLFRDGSNKWSIQLSRKLETGGTYQLYVTAAYQGMTTSQMFNVQVGSGEYYEYDVEDAEFGDKFGLYDTNTWKTIVGSDIKSLSGDTILVLKGNLGDDEETAKTNMRSINAVIWEIKTNIEIDMSGLTGLTTLTGISYYPYIYAENLTSIILPAAFTELKENSFSDGNNYFCKKLKSITIPATITSIHGNAFNGCSSLNQIIFSGEPIQGQSVVYRVDDNGFIFADEGADTTLVYVPSSYKPVTLNFATDFPDVTKLGGYVFAKSNIQSVTSFGNVKEIGTYTFNECKNLETIDLQGVQAVGYGSFLECNNLTTLGDYTALQSVDVAGFYNCNIAQFTITEDLTLEPNAFTSAIQELTIDIAINSANASNIKDLYLSKTAYAKHLIFNKTVNLPDVSYSGTPNSRITSAYLSNYNAGLSSVQSIEFKGTGSTIGNYSLVYFKDLTTVITNGNVTSIGNYAFYGCDKITAFDFQGVTSIGTYAFVNTGLIFADFSDNSSLTSIGESAFQGCSSLTGNLDFSQTTLTNLGQNAFLNCSAVTEVTFNDLITVIPTGAFKGCTGLSSLDLSNTRITIIGKNAFNGCSGLTSVNLSGPVKLIQESAFSDCGNINSLNLGTVTQIDRLAFYNTSGLSSITIPNTVIALGDSAFSTTSSITFEEMGANTTATWYQLEMYKNNAFLNASSQLWTQILQSPKSTLTNADFNEYVTEMQEQDGKSVETQITEIITGSNSTASPRFFRVITTN